MTRENAHLSAPSPSVARKDPGTDMRAAAAALGNLRHDPRKQQRRETATVAVWPAGQHGQTPDGWLHCLNLAISARVRLGWSAKQEAQNEVKKTNFPCRPCAAACSSFMCIRWEGVGQQTLAERAVVFFFFLKNWHKNGSKTPGADVKTTEQADQNMTMKLDWIYKDARKMDNGGKQNQVDVSGRENKAWEKHFPIDISGSPTLLARLHLFFSSPC